MCDADLLTAINAAPAAGNAILGIYAAADFGIETKPDNLPLTLADRAAHVRIQEQLRATRHLCWNGEKEKA